MRYLRLLLGFLWILAALMTIGCPTLAQEPTRVVFLHHSCGKNLIEQGGVREGLTQLGYEFYDHGYNEEGLRLPDGSYAGRNFGVPGDNTNPDGFADIFSQPLHDPPDNTFSYLMQYDVIAFKSCYPVSNITDNAQLEAYKQHYLVIRERMDQHPEKAFIIVTQPPLVPSASGPAAAERARAWTQWLQSDEFLAGHDNVFVFDFFDYLAGDNNFLRRTYRINNQDSHPNARANEKIGPHFVEFIDQVAQGVEPGESVAAPAEPESVEADLNMAWEASTSAPDVSMICGATSEVTHGGDPVVRLTYDIAEGEYADCGQYFEGTQDWSASEGVGFWFKTEDSGVFILTLLMGQPGEVSPFETTIDLGGGCCPDWVYFFFPWSDFETAQWAEADSANVLDPAQIIGYGFTVDAYGGRRAGDLLLDVIGPTKAGPQGGLVDEEGAPGEGGEPPSPGEEICFGPLALFVAVGGAVLGLRSRG
jgi:hypothetical protein